jgi:hypothetical protein
VVDLYTIEMHNMFMNTSVAIETLRGNPSPWLLVYSGKCRAFR